jgi:hypothetical protein
LAESLEKSFEPTQSLIDNFFNGLKIEQGIPVEIKFEPSLAKESIGLIDKKFDLRKKFSVFGDFGIKEFNKIFDKVDFKDAFDPKSVEAMNNALAEGSRLLNNMIDLSNTLTQSVGQGLANAFNNVFDALIEGKNVFKALGQAVRDLVIQVTKAVVQMLILNAVKNILSAGSGGIVSSGGVPHAVPGSGGLSAFPTSFGGIGGSRSAPTLTTRVSGTDLVFVLTQGQAQIGRGG